jgi:tetratricopeptide (TPR) repeat protein
MTPAEAGRSESDIESALAQSDIDRAEDLAASYQAAAGPPPGPSIPRPATDPRFRAAYLAGQVALAAGWLALAEERLAPLLPLAHRLPDEVTARLRFLLAEALARQHRPEEAGHILAGVPEVLLRHPLLRLRATRIRLWLGQVRELAGELAEMDCALEKTADTAHRALLACEEGRAWEAEGGLEAAARCWERADHLSQPLGAHCIRADLLLQMGRLNHLQGRLPAAIDHYDAALPHANGTQALEIAFRRALASMDMGQWSVAKDRCRALLGGRSIDLLSEEIRPLAALVTALLDGKPSDQAADEEREYQAARDGDPSAARALYYKALRAAPAPPRQARLALGLGLLSLAHADATEARPWLAQAESLARANDLPEVLIRAFVASGQLAAEREADEGLARRCFEEAVAVADVQPARFAHRGRSARQPCPAGRHAAVLGGVRPLRGPRRPAAAALAVALSRPPSPAPTRTAVTRR